MTVTPLDAAGLVGVLLLLIAYALTVARTIDPLRPPALLLNLFGAVGILVSLIGAFNISSFVIEVAWVLIAVAGLVRHTIRR